jgi:hypothetical protein
MGKTVYPFVFGESAIIHNKLPVPISVTFVESSHGSDIWLGIDHACPPRERLSDAQVARMTAIRERNRYTHADLVRRVDALLGMHTEAMRRYRDQAAEEGRVLNFEGIEEIKEAIEKDRADFGEALDVLMVSEEAALDIGWAEREVKEEPDCLDSESTPS